MKEMVDQRLESQLDLTTFYNQKIEFLQQELTTSENIREKLSQQNVKMKDEIKTLAKVIKTSRLHFKELETCDYEELNRQVAKYESQLAALKVSDSQIQEIKASKAKRRLNERQRKIDRDEINAEAELHGYKEKIAVPLDERTPKLALKELIKVQKPKKIHDKLPQYSDGMVSLEEVLAKQKRNQTALLFDENTLKVSKLDTKAALNEDSLTEPSIVREVDNEIFQTVCFPSQQSGESIASKANSLAARITSSKPKMFKNSMVSANGVDPFKAGSSEDF